MTPGAGGVLLKCHAGCPTERVVEELGLRMADLFDGGETPKPARANGNATPKRVAIYDYTDAQGEALARKVRLEPGPDGRGKTFLWEVPDGRGGWRAARKGEGNPNVLYRLREVLEAEEVIVGEGEKAADRLAAAGFVATCPPSPRWESAYSEAFRGKRVTIFADRDEPGEKRAREVLEALRGIAREARMVRAAVEVPKADAFDHLAAGLTVDQAVAYQVLDAVEAAPPAEAKRSPSRRPKRPKEDGRPEGGTADTQSSADAAPNADLANALRLEQHAREQLLYCAGVGWLVWSGARWEPDDAAALTLAAQTLGRVVMGECLAARAAGQEGLSDALWKWRRESEKKPRAEAALSLARSLLGVRADDLDAQPNRLPCPNGIVDLRTGVLHPSRPADRCTHVAAVEYDPTAHSDLWDRVLAHALPDRELRDYFHRAVGYAAVGDPRDDKLFVVHGPPASSKSTILGAITGALGSHALALGLDDLAERNRSGGARPELTRMRGRRLALASETGQHVRLDAGLVKLIAGGDRIVARDLYRGPVEFQPTFVCFLIGNHRPGAYADDDALWRRLVEIPFAVPVDEQARDPAVRARLSDPKGDLPAVLRWVVAGAMAYLAHGLGDPPESVRAATLDYRESQDRVRDFLGDHCELSETAWTPTEDLRAAYEQWCGKTGERALRGRAFASALRRHRCVDERKYAGRGWRGVALRTEA